MFAVLLMTQQTFKKDPHRLMVAACAGGRIAWAVVNVLP